MDSCQRCWLHKMRNILDKVRERPKSDVHRNLREICRSTTRTEPTSKIETLAISLSNDYSKAGASVRDDIDRRLAYFAFPQASWKNLRTTNPIGAVFSSARLCANVAKRLRSGASAHRRSSSCLSSSNAQQRHGDELTGTTRLHLQTRRPHNTMHARGYAAP